jgi:hypothetical protein
LGALGRFFDGLGKLAVFDAARSRSYAKLLIKPENRFREKGRFAGRVMGIGIDA